MAGWKELPLTPRELAEDAANLEVCDLSGKETGVGFELSAWERETGSTQGSERILDKRCWARELAKAEFASAILTRRGCKGRSLAIAAKIARANWVSVKAF